jgi:hypothetical protein
MRRLPGVALHGAWEPRQISDEQTTISRLFDFTQLASPRRALAPGSYMIRRQSDDK